MDISARIVARKVLLVYIYQYICLIKAQQADKGLSELFCIRQKDMQTDDYVHARCQYLIDQFFSYPVVPRVDKSFLHVLAKEIVHTKEEAYARVNQFTSTFQVERMDILDQSLFVLAYTEFTLLGTPREVLINEMIELAKRYGDNGSAKLINGILEKMLVKYSPLSE